MTCAGKSVCLCRVVSCKACCFTVFCQKKCHKKRKRRKKERKKRKERVTLRWTQVTQVQVLSVFYPEVPGTTLADSTYLCKPAECR